MLIGTSTVMLFSTLVVITSPLSGVSGVVSAVWCSRTRSTCPPSSRRKPGIPTSWGWSGLGAELLLLPWKRPPGRLDVRAGSELAALRLRLRARRDRPRDQPAAVRGRHSAG